MNPSDEVIAPLGWCASCGSALVEVEGLLTIWNALGKEFCSPECRAIALAEAKEK